MIGGLPAFQICNFLQICGYLMGFDARGFPIELLYLLYVSCFRIILYFDVQ